MDKQIEKIFNKDLVLREKLALQRTVMANQTTLLSFLRTAMYFLVAGISIGSLIKVEKSILIQLAFFVASFLILIVGIANYMRQKRKINESEIHIGNYKTDYLKQ
jgi:putative membrane protein